MALTHCVCQGDPQPGLNTTHAEGLWPAGAGEWPLAQWGRPSAAPVACEWQDCLAPLSLGAPRKAFPRLATVGSSQPWCPPELVASVTGFLHLLWMQRHVGKGVGVGQ